MLEQDILHFARIDVYISFWFFAGYGYFEQRCLVTDSHATHGLYCGIEAILIHYTAHFADNVVASSGYAAGAEAHAYLVAALCRAEIEDTCRIVSRRAEKIVYNLGNL